MAGKWTGPGLRNALMARAGPRLRGLLSLHALNDRLQRIEDTLHRLEYFSNGSRATFVGDNRVLVKVVAGGANLVYFVEANDKLLTPWFIGSGMYETDLTDYFIRNLRRDSHCLDVGSNFGYFTCLMGRFCPAGRVIGVEPDPDVFELAHDNVAANGLAETATVRHAAAGASNDEMTLYRRHTRSGNTSIARMSDDFTRHMREAPVTPFTIGSVKVDQLADDLGGRVDFMKVDVEGAEPLVFEGARETIAHNPQLAIVMEWAPYQIREAGFDPADFLDRLRALGLRAADLVDGQEQPLEFDALLALPYRAGVVLRRA